MHAAWPAFWLSRLLVAVVAVFAALKLDPAASGNEAIYDDPGRTHPFDGWPGQHVLDLLFSPLARWDSVYYLAIADDGYAGSEGGVRAGFFPLYPLLVRLVSGLAASPGLVLIAAYAVSLAAFLAALVLFERLAARDLGERVARAAVLLLAFFPASLFFGAPYSESVFLLVSVGAVWAAREGRWWLAGLLAAAASAARIPGLVLLVPLALMFFLGPREGGRPPLRRLAWLALAPVGALLFSLELALALDDPLAWADVQSEAQQRELGLPFEGVWEGVRAAGAGALDLAAGRGQSFPASQNLINLAFLAFAAVAVWGAFRRLPVAYAAYALVALALPLSTPPGEPLVSLPRYVAVLFPLFMWLAIECEEREVTQKVLIAFAFVLGAFTAQFATWQWVA